MINMLKVTITKKLTYPFHSCLCVCMLNSKTYQISLCQKKVSPSFSFSMVRTTQVSLRSPRESMSCHEAARVFVTFLIETSQRAREADAAQDEGFGDCFSGLKNSKRWKHIHCDSVISISNVSFDFTQTQFPMAWGCCVPFNQNLVLVRFVIIRPLQLT